MYYPLDDFAEPDFFVLQEADRFHTILHSGEIHIPDGTTMVLVIFIIRRVAGVFDQFIVNKFFRPDGTVSRSFMSKCDIPPTEIEQTLATTASTFAHALRSPTGPVIHWDELDLQVGSTGGGDWPTDACRGVDGVAAGAGAGRASLKKLGGGPHPPRYTGFCPAASSRRFASA